MSDLWVMASIDVEAEQREHRLMTATVAATTVWPFLAIAQSEDEFEQRLALVADRIEEAAGEDAEAVTAQFRQDFKTMREGQFRARVAAENSRRAQAAMKVTATVCEHCGNEITKKKDPSGQRGEAWAEDSWGDDRDFQCGVSGGQHEPATKESKLAGKGEWTPATGGGERYSGNGWTAMVVEASDGGYSWSLSNPTGRMNDGHADSLDAAKSAALAAAPKTGAVVPPEFEEHQFKAEDEKGNEE